MNKTIIILSLIAASLLLLACKEPVGEAFQYGNLGSIPQQGDTGGIMGGSSKSAGISGGNLVKPEGCPLPEQVKCPDGNCALSCEEDPCEPENLICPVGTINAGQCVGSLSVCNMEKSPLGGQNTLVQAIPSPDVQSIDGGLIAMN